MNREPELTNPDSNTPEPTTDTAEPENPPDEKTIFQDYYLLEGENIDVCVSSCKSSGTLSTLALRSNK